MKKSILYTYIVVFTLLISSIGILTILNKGEIDAGNFAILEKRNPAIRPDWKWDIISIDNYFHEFDGYLNDVFSYRNELIQSYSNLLYFIGVSSDPQKVALGKNGFFFLGNSYNGVIDQTTGKLRFDETELNSWKLSFQQRQKFLQILGIPFLAVMVPNQHSVYEEYLPDYIVPAKENVFDQIIKSGPGFNLLHLKDTLIASKVFWGDYLYNKTDSHWSEIGAYVGYRKIIDQLKTSLPKIIPILLEKEDFIIDYNPGGQNKKLLNITTPVDDFEVQLLRSSKWNEKLVKTTYNGDTLPFDPYQFISYHEKAVVYNQGKPYTVLIYEDSFSIRLSVFLNQTFGKIIYCHYSDPESYEYSTLVEKFKPDLVLYEFGEQSLLLHSQLHHNIINQVKQNDFKRIGKLNLSTIIDKKNNFIHIEDVKIVENELYFKSSGEDPQLILPGFTKTNDKTIGLKIDMTCPEKTAAQIFYLTDENKNYMGEKSVILNLEKGRQLEIFYLMDKGVKTDKIRFDPGTVQGNYIIHSVEILESR